MEPKWYWLVVLIVAMALLVLSSGCLCSKAERLKHLNVIEKKRTPSYGEKMAKMKPVRADTRERRR